ncbi:MAG: DNA translocase FtsK 4TM domain-containing protein [bacterium]|nr:DNA translocase FtsK 4TM domain-containing protein [bacterium]
MKICPTCKEVYKDDELNFCLSDGTTLLTKKGGKGPKHSRVNEVVSVALVALALLIFLCLMTASPDDRSVFSTGYSGTSSTKNWIGIVGSNVAAVLIGLLGWVAYLLPALIALIAWRVYQSADLKLRALRVIGYVLFLAGLSGLLYMIEPAYGGVIGGAFPYLAMKLIGSIGTAIVLGAFFVASLLLITDISFNWLFGHVDIAKDNFKIHASEYLEKRRQAKAALAGSETLEPDSKITKRRKKALTDSPTISIPDTIVSPPAAPKTGDILVPATTQLDAVSETVAELPLEEDRIPPTIAVDDSAAFPSGPLGEIPITPVKHTGELNDEDVVEEEPEDESPFKLPTQTYEGYRLPSPQLLHLPQPRIQHKDKELLAIAESLAEKTKEFNVAGKVVNISPGPVVTTYEFKPDPGVKYSRVTGLVDDLCLALRAESIRIDRIPGKAFVGIEVPNQKRETIVLREIIDHRKFHAEKSLLTIALGKTIDGGTYVADLAKMPHLLIAGATGAGKSVGVNSLVMSILFKAKPDEVKFIMVDPKRLELGLYADIPHLATPIITDPKRAAISLKWAVTEMERRYKDLAGWGVRNIDGYNTEVKKRNDAEQWDDTGQPHRTLPFIVIIIDELADLMMVSGKEVEESITRLAQMARAVGIHLVLATQRPSVDVITGLIKANFPARMSYRVSSKVDSRTIIDANGAESLLGKGDMLYLPPATSQVVRIHGCYVDEVEIGKVVAEVKRQGRPEYDTTITKSEEELDDSGDLPGRRDPLFWDALKCVVHAKRGSTSLLQRHLRIGYGRAAAILDAMVKEGYIGDMDGSTRARPVLSKAYEDLADVQEMGANG